MGFSFNPSLLFVCRSCKHLFQNTDELKAHKLAHHLGECLATKCIIFQETVLDYGVLTQDKECHDSIAWSLPGRLENLNQNQNQVSYQPNFKFHNPYVSLVRLNPTDISHRDVVPHTLKAKQSKSRAIATDTERTSGAEETKIASLIPKSESKYEVCKDETEAPTLTESSTATLSNSNANHSDSDKDLVLGNGDFIVASIETSADGSGLVQFQSTQFYNFEGKKELDATVNDSMDELFDQYAELAMHTPKSEDETYDGLEEAAQLCPIAIAMTSESEPEPSTKKRIKNPYSCTISSKNFKSKSALWNQNHMQRHSEKMWKCTHVGCLDAFKDQKALNLHLETHKRYTCSVSNCNTIFSHPFPFNCHMLTHEVGQGTCSTSPFPNEEAAAGKTIIKCSQCSGIFKFKESLYVHMVRAHGKKTNFRCIICGKYFATKTDVEDHERRHMKDYPFKCDVPNCSKAFVNKKELLRHQKSIHVVELGLGKFICSTCGKAFGLQYRLKNHMKTHENFKSFKCTWDTCSQEFRNKRKMVKHVKIVHAPDSPYQFEKCGKEIL